LIVAFWVILENRSPQSTFAWIFLLLLVPGLGVLIYYFFGRGWRAFSKEAELARQTMMGDSPEQAACYLQCEKAMAARIAKMPALVSKQKLVHLVTKNPSSVLTAYNQLCILQDAQDMRPLP